MLSCTESFPKDKAANSMKRATNCYFSFSRREHACAVYLADGEFSEFAILVYGEFQGVDYALCVR